ncbi:MAG: hypothetical protein LLG00_00820 [Planctomycetaceae bacterium]|nr:hypothetical protein [Planctomycetaceae bacterium]
MQVTGVVLGLVLLAQGPSNGLAPTAPSLAPPPGIGGTRTSPPALGPQVPGPGTIQPSSTIPSNTIPSNRIPPNTLAPNALPPNTLAPSTPAVSPAKANAGRRSGGATDMVTDAVRLPSGATVTGQPITLLAALSPTADRRRQLDIVRAYWRLFEAVGEYRYAFDFAKSVESIRARGNEESPLRAARAAAAAELRQSELDATSAQHELAALLGSPVESPLPLCADRPCVAAYRTHFKELFTGRTPPDSARLADKKLPLQCQVLNDRAAAVQAAEDALTAVTDDLQSGRSDAVAVATCSRELFRQRMAFLQAAADYNRQIADYAFVAVPPTYGVQELVRSLIGPMQPAANEGQPARPAGGNTSTTANSAQQIPREPTLARRPRPTQPTSTEGWRPVEPTPATRSNTLRPAAKSEPTLAPPLRSDEAGRRSLDGISSSPSPLSRAANRAAMPAGLADTIPSASSTERSAVVQTSSFDSPGVASPAIRAKQLTSSLHWNGALWEGDGCKPITLSECLRRDASGNRRATIDAYWLVWQQAARYKAALDEQSRLKALAALVLERRNSPAGAADMLRLNTAQTAAKAAVGDAKVALVDAQYALALRIGTVADAWPQTATAPHSGSYLTNLERQPRNVAESRAARRLAAMMPHVVQNVQERATSVVETENARGAVAENYRRGAAAIDQVIDSVTAETEQSLAFIDSLMQYNRAIAEYVLLVFPATTPADKLVESLVTKS